GPVGGREGDWDCFHRGFEQLSRAPGVIGARQRDSKEDSSQRKVRRRSDLNLGLERPRGNVLVGSAITRSRGRPPAAASAARKAPGDDQPPAIAGELSAGTAATAALTLRHRGGNHRADAGAEGHQLTINPYTAEISAGGALRLPKDLGAP